MEEEEIDNDMFKYVGVAAIGEKKNVVVCYLLPLKTVVYVHSVYYYHASTALGVRCFFLLPSYNFF